MFFSLFIYLRLQLNYWMMFFHCFIKVAFFLFFIKFLVLFFEMKVHLVFLRFLYEIVYFRFFFCLLVSNFFWFDSYYYHTFSGFRVNVFCGKWKEPFFVLLKNAYFLQTIIQTNEKKIIEN